MIKYIKEHYDTVNFISYVANVSALYIFTAPFLQPKWLFHKMFSSSQTNNEICFESPKFYRKIYNSKADFWIQLINNKLIIIYLYVYFAVRCIVGCI